MQGVALAVETVHLRVVGLIAPHAVAVAEIRQLIHGQQGYVYVAVLNRAAILALVLVLHPRLVLHNDAAVFVHVHLRPLAHLLDFLVAPPLLYADALVHLCLENAKLVHFGLGRHAQPPVAAGAATQSGPEVRKLIYHGGVVADGGPQVSHLVVEQGTVVDGHEILRLHPDDEVEVADGPVVVAQLHAEQSAVVVGQKVVGFQVDGHVIISHGPPEIVGVEPCKSAVHIVVCQFWPQVNGLA